MSEHLLGDKNTFVTRFGSNDPSHPALTQLHALVFRVPTEEGRVEWLEGLGDWLFADTLPARLALMLEVASAVPSFGTRVRETLVQLASSSSSTRLFADTGIGTRIGFWGELVDRFSRTVLPEPPVEHELSRVFVRLLGEPARVRAVLALGESMSSKLVELLGVERPEFRAAVERGQREALVLLASRISTHGSSDELRTRLPGLSVEASPFLALPLAVHALLKDASEFPRVEQLVASCRVCLTRIEGGLNSSGISIDLVYRVEFLQALLTRVQLLTELQYHPEQPVRAEATSTLTRALLEGAVADRSLGALWQSGTRLLARRFVERAGSSGEHYLTRTRTEQQAMLDAAAGGGAITALAVFAKFFITFFHAPPVFDALLIGLNYAWCFVAMQLLHFALATKQPSMTAATLAGAIEAQKERANLEPLVDLVARASRTQFAALVGNVFIVIPFALSIGLLFEAVVGHHVLDTEYAERTIRAHHPLASVTLFSAAVTGVWLWASSLLSGATENWFVLNELSGAIASNRSLRRVIGVERAQRLARFLTENISGLGGNVGFAMLLGFMPMLFVLVGIPLEVRHVTFVTGQLAYAALQLGPTVFARGDFLLALLSIPMVGLVNFGVSFAFAIVVALRARGLGVRSQLILLRAVTRCFVTSPGQFFLAPPDVKAAGHSEPAAVDSH